MSEAFDVNIAATAGNVTATGIGVALLLGLLTPLLGALRPAWRAAQAEPAVALREPERDQPLRAITALVGVGLFAVGTAIAAGFVGLLGGSASPWDWRAPWSACPG